MMLKFAVRNWWQNLIGALLVAIAFVSVILFSQNIRSLESDLDRLYETMTVDGEIIALNASDDIVLTPEKIEQIVDSSCVKNYGLMGEYRIDRWKTLRAISSITIDPSLSLRIDGAEYAKGITDIFADGTYCVLIPRNMRFDPGDTLSLEVGTKGQILSLAVGGVYGNPESAASDGQILYCSLDTYSRFLCEAGEPCTYKAMELVFCNLRELDGYRKMIEGLDLTEENAQLVIHDRQFQSEVSGFRRQITYQKTVLFLIILMTIVISFFFAVLLLRGRSREVLLMRTLGMSFSGVFFWLLFEICCQALIGVVLGLMVIVCISDNSQTGLVQGLGIAVAYIAGGAISLIRIVRKNSFSGKNMLE